MSIKMHTAYVPAVTEVEGRTVEECIDQLIKRYPALEEVPLKQFDIYIIDYSQVTHISWVVKDGDEIFILSPNGCCC